MKRRLFTLARIGNGYQCTAKRTRATGWGGTADLAIADFHRQFNLRPCFNCGKSRNDHRDMRYCYNHNACMFLEEL